MTIKTKIKQDFLSNYETKLEIEKVIEKVGLRPRTKAIKKFSFTYACCMLLIIGAMGVLIIATATTNNLDIDYSSSISNVVEIEKINEYYQLMSNYKTDSIEEPGKWSITITKGTMVEEGTNKFAYIAEINLPNSNCTRSGLIIESRDLDYQKYFSINTKRTILITVDADKIDEKTCTYFIIYQGDDKFTIKYNL